VAELVCFLVAEFVDIQGRSASYKNHSSSRARAGHIQETGKMEVVFCLLFSLPYSLVSQADVPLLFGHNHATAPGRLPRLTDDSRLRTRDGGDSNVRADDRSSNVQCVPAYPVFLELFLRAV
jgi:hypothetical protein